MKKFLSVIMLVCIVMSMCTVSAWASAGITVNGAGNYATLSEAIGAANSGNTIQLPAGTFEASALPNGQGKILTIKGAGRNNTTLIMKNAYNGHTGDNYGSLRFESLTIEEDNNTHNGIAHSGPFYYYDCNISGQYFAWSSTTYNFESCSFIQTSSDAYNIWTYSATNITFTNCGFESAGKSMLVYHEGNTTKTVNISGCVFNASSVVAGKAAIEMDSTYHPIVLNIDTQTAASGFDETSLCGNQLWNEKANNVTGVQGGQATVVKNGVKIYENKTHIIPPPDVPNPDPGTDPGTNPGVTPNNPAPAAPVVENVYYIPATDDNSNMALWSILALALLSTAFVTRKRKSEN